MRAGLRMITKFGSKRQITDVLLTDAIHPGELPLHQPIGIYGLAEESPVIEL